MFATDEDRKIKKNTHQQKYCQDEEKWILDKWTKQRHVILFFHGLYPNRTLNAYTLVIWKYVYVVPRSI